jgi:hypothetical protein
MKTNHFVQFFFVMFRFVTVDSVDFAEHCDGAVLFVCNVVDVD